MHDAAIPPGRHGETASLEDFQHRHVLGQHFGDEFLERGGACDPDQMGDEMGGDTTLLMRVVDRKRDLCATGPTNDIP